MTADATRQKFTSKERDNESGLDYFLARYYSSAHGRFTSIDPENAGANPDDAQSWNAYAYARNHPLGYIDPDGRLYVLCDPEKHCSIHSDANVNEWRKTDGVRFQDGNIFDRDGNKLGTYQRIWFDDESELFNRTVFGVASRAAAIKQAIVAFGIVTVAVGASGGTAAYYLGVPLGGSSITTLGLGEVGGGTITGLYGTTTVATLEGLAASSGPTEAVVVNLTNAPVAGRALSVATGSGAEALASAARTGGTLFRAEIL